MWIKVVATYCNRTGRQQTRYERTGGRMHRGKGILDATRQGEELAFFEALVADYLSKRLVFLTCAVETFSR